MNDLFCCVLESWSDCLALTPNVIHASICSTRKLPYRGTGYRIQVQCKALVVSRTALRVRNRANAPDEWETGVLKKFEQVIAKGTPAAELSHGEQVGNEYRDMPTGSGHGLRVGRYARSILPS